MHEIKEKFLKKNEIAHNREEEEEVEEERNKAGNESSVVVDVKPMSVTQNPRLLPPTDLKR